MYKRNTKIFSVIGAGGKHSNEERELNDYYATDPKAVQLLLDNEKFNKNIWECCYGEGAIGDVLENNNYKVYKTDIIQRTKPLDKLMDFLSDENNRIFKGDIVTNPPYKLAKEIIEKAFKVTSKGSKIAMFLKLTFLESKSRKQFFLDNPPKVLYVSSSRLKCFKNGDYSDKSSSAIAFCWYVWENGYKGDTIIKWIN